MSEKPQAQDLTLTVQEMMAQMARMQAKIESLEAQSQISTQPTDLTRKELSMTRRKTLKRMGLALLGGVAAAGSVNFGFAVLFRTNVSLQIIYYC